MHTYSCAHKHTHADTTRPPPPWQYTLELPWASGGSRCWASCNRNLLTAFESELFPCSPVPGGALQGGHLIDAVELTCVNHAGRWQRGEGFTAQAVV